MGANINIIQRPVQKIYGHEGTINCMALSSDGSLLVTGSEDTNVRMWSIATIKTECLGTLKGHSDYITALAIYDTFVISGSTDATIRKWEMTTCECLYVYIGHKFKITKILVTGNYIFSSSNDKTVRAWQLDTDNLMTNQDNISMEEIENRKEENGGLNPSCIKIFKGHTNVVFNILYIPGINVAFGGNDRHDISPSDLLISGSGDFTAKSWSFKTGKNLKTFTGHRASIGCMVTDPMAKIFYTGSADSTIRAWNISLGECMRVMEGHLGPVLSLIAEDRILFSSSSDGTVVMWHKEFGDIARRFTGHNHSVPSIKYNSGILFTASGDTIIRAFDASTGALLAKLEGHDAAVNDVIVVRDKLYSGSEDTRLIVWNTANLVASRGPIISKVQQERRTNFENRQNETLQNLEQNIDEYYTDDMLA